MPRPATAPPDPTTLGKILPWWSKLVHRVLIAEALGRSGPDSEERAHLPGGARSTATSAPAGSVPGWPLFGGGSGQALRREPRAGTGVDRARAGAGGAPRPPGAPSGGGAGQPR